MCARDSRAETHRLFGDEAMYVPYSPGYELFISLKNALSFYRDRFTHDPKLIFLENHGVFVSADSAEEIKELFAFITTTIASHIQVEKEFHSLPLREDLKDFLPYIRMSLSSGKACSVLIRHTSLHQKFYQSKKNFKQASAPFTPDMVRHCKAAFMYIEESASAETIKNSFDQLLPDFISRNGYSPKIIMIKDLGVLSVEEDALSSEIAFDVYEDLMKVSLFSNAFGGPRFLNKKAIDFEEQRKEEELSRKASKEESADHAVNQKVVIVTGAAQGFGEGIAEDLVRKGANVLIADLNEKLGKQTAVRLSQQCKKNKVIFHQTDVSDYQSVEKAIFSAVITFGGLDILISNAGILHAGGLEEMSPELFDKMTQVNYSAWFNCVKAASSVMKLQSVAKKDYSMDMIQINSKSGLEGSNRNFAYAGAKFGGIGLTQSFALELAKYGIKVNAVCPGNFFEGPLWSDPEKGLLLQYLETGKVPGAKTIEDVRSFYESKVPLGRGCRVADVLKAIYYIIEQQYETGQAIPVTGGQIMLH